MSKTNYIVGIVLGLLSPVIGVFLGLQVSTWLGNVFAFPFIAVSFVSGVPLGMWNPVMWALGFLFSIAIWVMIVFIYKKLTKKKSVATPNINIPTE